MPGGYLRDYFIELFFRFFGNHIKASGEEDPTCYVLYYDDWFLSPSY